MAIGFIYVLTNTYMPGLVKIGYTDRNPRTRANELSAHTGVPGKFAVAASWEVNDARLIEQRIFSCLAEYRVEGGEFFKFASEKNCIQSIVLKLTEWGELDQNGKSIPTSIREKREATEYSERMTRAISAWRLKEVEAKDAACKRSAYIKGHGVHTIEYYQTKIAETEQRLRTGSRFEFKDLYFGAPAERLKVLRQQEHEMLYFAAAHLHGAMSLHFKEYFAGQRNWSIPKELWPLGFVWSHLKQEMVIDPSVTNEQLRAILK